MTMKEFELSIKNSFLALLEIGVTDWSHFPRKGSLEPSKEFNKVALNSSSSYEEIYKAALRQNYFNFSLCDHSFFQFSIRAVDDDFLMRYAFYPNPYKIDDIGVELLGEALIDDFSYIDQAFDEANLKIDKPPIRYDYDPNGYAPCNHPAGHLHVGGHSANRWPVGKILSPETFSLFVTKQYYSNEWFEYGANKPSISGFDNPMDHRYALSTSRCERVSDELFTEQETEHLFLS